MKRRDKNEKKGGKINKQDHVMFSVSLFRMWRYLFTGVYFVFVSKKSLEIN